MTQEDILRMAIDAGATDCADPDKWGILEISYENLERFAKLVAAHEREECAKVCESYQDAVDRHKWPNGYECAAAIRARGEK